MAAIYLYGWDDVNKVWVKVQVDSTGKILLDSAQIIDDVPVDGETGKAISSNWAYDHKADESAHHTKYTDSDARASINNIFGSDGKANSSIDMFYWWFGNLNRFSMKYQSSSTHYTSLLSQNNSADLYVIGVKVGVGVVKSYMKVWNGSAYKILQDADHDHTSGNGAQIDHTTLSNIGYYTHAQIDTFINNSIARSRAITSTTQVFTASSYIIVQYDTVIYNNYNLYESTTYYRFTADETGVYSVKASLLLDNASWALGTQIYLVIFKNGVTYSILSFLEVNVSGAYYKYLSGTDNVLLNATDYIDIRVAHSDSSSHSIATGISANQFSVDFLR